MKDYIKKRISEQQEICLTLSKDALKRAQKIFERLSPEAKARAKTLYVHPSGKVVFKVV